MRNMRIIKIINAYPLPSPWDYLLDASKKDNYKSIIAVIYTEKFIEENNGKNVDGRKIKHDKYGIHKNRFGYYDIIVHSKEINSCIIREKLKDLSKKTKQKYIFVGDRTYDDDIYDFAEKLMNKLDNLCDKQGYHDEKKLKSYSAKADLIGVWIGEFLNWVVTDKDVRTLESLWTTVRYEIIDLIKPEKKSKK